MTISEAIKEIVKLEGLVIFNDYRRFRGFLADFSTDTHKRELDIFKNAVDENMLKMCIDDTLENSRKISKLRYVLETKGISEDWINFIIESFALPLGWNYTPRPTTQQQPQTKQTKQLPKQQPSSQNEWTCSCGTVNTTNYCGNCGSAKPVSKSLDWTCVCGTVNTTKFCTTCGKQQPVQQRQAQQPVQQKQAQQPIQQKQAQQPVQQKQAQEPVQQKQAQEPVQQKQVQQPVQQQGNLFKNANIGDYVKFGNYPQTADGGSLPIEWLVLARENNKMLVISRYGLDSKRFDSQSNNWENSEIRQWLNGEFYNKVFNANEKKLIKGSSIFENLFGRVDKVFLLSREEVEKYFANDDARKCKASDYAKNNGAYVFGNGCSWWWLRSPYLSSSNCVYYVSDGGNFDICLNVDYDYNLVRPALWINL